jgi:hypothetical protein
MDHHGALLLAQKAAACHPKHLLYVGTPSFYFKKIRYVLCLLMIRYHDPSNNHKGWVDGRNI